MKVTTNNKTRKEIKMIMDKLAVCMKDLTISKKDRNLYYSEYLKLSKDYILLSK